MHTTRSIPGILVLLTAIALPWHGALAARAPATPAQSPQVTALRSLEAASKVPLEVRFRHGFPRGVHGRVPVAGKTAADRARNFMTTYRELYRQTDPDLALDVRRATEGSDQQVLFYQTWKGLEVQGAQLLVMLHGKEVRATIGGLLGGDVRVAPVPYLSLPQAEMRAREILSRPDADIDGQPTLVVFDRSLYGDGPPEPHLAWRMIVGGGIPTQVLLDAHDGQALQTSTQVYEHGGDPMSGFNLKLKDVQGAADTDDICFTKSSGIVVGEEDWFDHSRDGDVDAVVAYQHAQSAYGFYHDMFDWHSYDDGYSTTYAESTLLEVNVHAGVPNAWWHPKCENIAIKTGWVDLDVIGHELAHGIGFARNGPGSGWDYVSQSGGLAEHYADMMGVFADNWVEQDDPYYVQNLDVGEDRTNGEGPIRSINFPEAYGQPDNTADQGYLDAMAIAVPAAENDWGGVHSLSGVPNRGGSRIINGGNYPDGPNGENTGLFPGMGRYKAAQLKFNALTHLHSTATFVDAREYEVAKATEWAQSATHGFGPLDVCIVRASWANVGVGGAVNPADCNDYEYADDPDGDYISSSIDNCDDVANPDQGNHDLDPFGDACDPDDDNDGFDDEDDQCPLDVNFDGQNGPCDDIDDDGVLNHSDNCPADYNPLVLVYVDGELTLIQPDSDGNGWGDACEDDKDGDGMGIGDNCPNVPNPGQEDADGEGYGDVCDFCPNHPYPNPGFTPSGTPLQADSDDDGIGDDCDDSPVYVDGSPIGETPIRPDRKKGYRIELESTPLREVAVPLVVCPGKCAKGPSLKEQMKLVVTGLDDDVLASIVDDKGNVVRTGGHRTREELTFQPLGGQEYFLAFEFEGGAARAPRAFELRMTSVKVK